MSADNYYVIRKHPLGGYAAVQGCASVCMETDEDPEATALHLSFPTVHAAFTYAESEGAEYGVSIDSECTETYWWESLPPILKEVLQAAREVDGLMYQAHRLVNMTPTPLTAGIERLHSALEAL